MKKKEEVDDFSSITSMEYLRFGKYPTQPQADLLIEAGYTVFVNLTRIRGEALPPYSLREDCEKIRLAIMDSRVPRDSEAFDTLMCTLAEHIRAKKNVYVHCRGGHGRAGLVIACFLGLLELCDGRGSEEACRIALEKTKYYHSKRINMEEKWRIMGAPQTRIQKVYVRKYLERMEIYFH
jgi:protein tyrosine/serine phosphatase